MENADVLQRSGFGTFEGTQGHLTLLNAEHKIDNDQNFKNTLKKKSTVELHMDYIDCKTFRSLPSCHPKTPCTIKSST